MTIRTQSELEDVWIYRENDDWEIHIKANFSQIEKDQLVCLLKQYKQIFTWSLVDMLGININAASHKLSTDPGVKPIQRKKRNHEVKQ